MFQSARISGGWGFIVMKKPLSLSLISKIASDLEERLAIVVDPMLATGGSMISTIDLLKAKGCQHIKVLVLVAAPEGDQSIRKSASRYRTFTCASIDDHLNEQGYIIPGLG